MKMSPDDLMKRMFAAAIAAAQPSLCVPRYMPTPRSGRTIVIGAGKASAAMARAFEDHWEGPLSGLVVTRYGYSVPCSRIEIVEAAHPVPDSAGVEAARRMMDLVADLSEDDLVVCLISGGGSSLLSMPLDGLTLVDKQTVNSALLSSGATIAEMNCVRRHMSGIKGGRLAVQCSPAQVLNLIISDVPGDDPTNIASGPTVADPTTCADAIAILDRYAIVVPEHVRNAISSGLGETPKPGDLSLNVTTQIIAAPQASLEAAASIARSEGFDVHILGDSIEGEAKEAGTVMAGIVRQIVARNQPFPKPCVLLSGGETTVKVKGRGRGGRNVEFLLALGVTLDGLQGVHALAGDTDGVDGIEEIAGAILRPDSLARAMVLGIRAREQLDDNNGHGFFAALDDAVVTGPTNTNVNDFRVVLIQ